MEKIKFDENKASVWIIKWFIGIFGLSKTAQPSALSERVKLRNG
jgi:hypothetical protein